jgi:Kef-type K+ transport system membrane component KefB
MFRGHAASYISTENLIVVVLAMAIAAGIPVLLRRLPLRGVVIEIVLGAVIGPQVLGLVHPGTTMNFLADFGLGMLSLMAGFEMDPVGIAEHRHCPTRVRCATATGRRTMLPPYCSSTTA